MLAALNPVELENIAQRLVLRGSNASTDMIVAEGDSSSVSCVRMPDYDISFWKDGEASTEHAFGVVAIRSHTGASWYSCFKPASSLALVSPLAGLRSIVNTIRIGDILPVGSAAFEDLLTRAATRRNPENAAEWAHQLSMDVGALND